MTGIRIVQCREPDDMNYRGWDLLAKLPDGTYSCFAEVRDFALVLAILNGTAPAHVLDNVESTYRMVTASWSDWKAAEEAVTA